MKGRTKIFGILVILTLAVPLITATTAFGKIRTYNETVLISADDGAYTTLKSNFVGVHRLFEIFHYAFKSASYNLKIYTSWKLENDMPVPDGPVVFYAKRAYIQGFERSVGLNPDPDNDGFCGLTQPGGPLSVLVIGRDA